MAARYAKLRRRQNRTGAGAYHGVGGGVGDFGQDLRFGVRALRKSPAFTAVALATIALGIGANTAIFSVVSAVLFRPLPFPRPDELVAVFQTNPGLGVAQNGVSYPNYADWAGRARSFEDLAALRMHDYTLTGAGEPELVAAGTVTSNLFRLLRVRPLAGRVLAAEDDAPGAPAVVLLGERLWRSRFGADPAIVGRSITLDGRLCEVVGVAPASFKTPPEYPPAELWLTLTHDPIFADLGQRRGGHYLRILGRLANGIGLESAQAELAAIEGGLARDYPKENEGWGVRLVPLAESLVSGVRTALLVLLAAVGLVFLIACANVANLLLARGSARSREIAVRMALGAGRGRLVRQLLTESLLLGLAGGVLGLGLAFAGLRGLRAWLPADLPRSSEIHVDAAVLLFALGTSVLAAVVFGLAPAVATASVNLSTTLKEGSAAAGAGRGRRRVRGLLVVAEIALSFLLLAGAGLLLRSLVRLQEVPLGFHPESVLTAGLSLPRAQYSKPEQWIAFYRRLSEALQSEPGVVAAAAVLPLPLEGGGLNFGFTIEGRPDQKPGGDRTANYTALTPEYFRVLGVSLVRGRLFAPRDAAGATRVCAISSAFAGQYFPGEDPIGKRLVFGFTESVPREIVGIVADVKRNGPGAPSQPEMYVPFDQDPWWAAYVAVRVRGDPERLASVLRASVRSLDPTLPVADIQPMSQIVADSIAEPRFRAMLLGLFAGLALLLAVIGIYGVVSYDVGRRSREIGIRLALGAERKNILQMILRRGLALAVTGAAVGLIGAILVSYLMRNVL
ncbi:MAG TPA: ABC transporter permease, partial [Thermoanaerobaculia bacterium]|nr:ABC transporter permease [Thermoanaerobaculia bacterium]